MDVRQDKGCLLVPFLFSIVREVLVLAIREEKVNRIQIAKEVITLSLFMLLT